MLLKVKNVYGIKNKIEFRTSKNNLIIFAPNGTGKTSIAKGVEDIFTGAERRNMEGAFTSYEGISLESGGIKYQFSEGGDTRLAIINQKSISSVFTGEENFFDQIYKMYQIKTSSEISSEIYKLFSEVGVNELMENAGHYDDSISGGINLINVILDANRDKNMIDLQNLLKKMEDKHKVLQNVSSAFEEFLKSKSKIKPHSFVEEIKVIEGVSSAPTTKIFDKKIIDEIFEKERQEYFKYSMDKVNFISLEEAVEKITKELEGKYEETETSFINSMLSCWGDLSEDEQKKISNKRTTFNTGAKYFNEQMQKNSLEIKRIKICLQKDVVEKVIEKFQKDSTDYLKKINEQTLKINELFESGILEWKIKITPPNKISEKPIVSFWRGDDLESIENFEEYGSDGEKSIVSLIANIIINQDVKVIVFDDIFSSMDNHHINEFNAIIGDDRFKKIDKLILTHNFGLFRDFAFSPTSQKFDFFILDKTKNKKSTLENFVLKTNFEELRGLMNLHSVFSNATMATEEKILLGSNIIREIIGGYLFNGIPPVLGLNKNQNNEYDSLAKIKNNKYFYLELLTFIDSSIRHYKKNIDNEHLKTEIKRIFKEYNMGVIPPTINDFFELILTLDDKESFGDYILQFKEEKFIFGGLSDYITYKVIYGTNIRFLIEEFNYYNDGENLTWENPRKWNDAPKTQHHLPTFDSNYLVHVNSVQWTKIVEMPIYKISKLKAQKQNAINTHTSK